MRKIVGDKKPINRLSVGKVLRNNNGYETRVNLRVVLLLAVIPTMESRIGYK